MLRSHLRRSIDPKSEVDSLCIVLSFRQYPAEGLPVPKEKGLNAFAPPYRGSTLSGCLNGSILNCTSSGRRQGGRVSACPHRRVGQGWSCKEGGEARLSLEHCVFAVSFDGMTGREVRHASSFMTPGPPWDGGRRMAGTHALLLSGRHCDAAGWLARCGEGAPRQRLQPCVNKSYCPRAGALRPSRSMPVALNAF